MTVTAPVPVAPVLAGPVLAVSPVPLRFVASAALPASAVAPNLSNDRGSA